MPSYAITCHRMPSHAILYVMQTTMNGQNMCNEPMPIKHNVQYYGIIMMRICPKLLNIHVQSAAHVRTTFFCLFFS